jgi:spermidine synthase
MLPWKLLDKAPIPGDGGELHLYQRGSEYSIRVGSYELMNSRVYGSEDALAAVSNEHLADRARARVLIGGLGMGFTLRRLLKELGPGSEVAVAELVPAVVTWHRGPLAELSAGALDDRRVTVRETDVGEVIREASMVWDAILLDVDNGPAALTSNRNDWLYSSAGLRSIHRALRADGILAVWSAGPDSKFTARLKRSGFETEEVRVRSRGAAGGARFLIWIARRK